MQALRQAKCQIRVFDVNPKTTLVISTLPPEGRAAEAFAAVRLRSRIVKISDWIFCWFVSWVQESFVFLREMGGKQEL
jgi:hypothetical protein